MGKIVNLTGQRYGRLTVLDLASQEINTGRARWSCLCDCGKIIEVSNSSLRSGKTKSCGCLRREKTSIRSKTHGKRHTRLYSIWVGMRRRCRDKNSNRYQSYGGRGIKVCDEWIDDFACFYNWAINNGYSENLTIDRIDNNGNYDPANCRWATNEMQSNNRRRNHFITIGDDIHTISEWARIKGLKSEIIRGRIKRGWKPEDAILVAKKRSKV